MFADKLDHALVFSGLLGGLVFSIVLVYLLIVVNFQSWLDPLIIISALPAALAGILWFLFATRTTISVPAMIGAIMCVGVATSNSILVVSFAKEQMEEGKVPSSGTGGGVHAFSARPHDGAGYDYRHGADGPGNGEGGEQNAPLGRAVIGGLLFATVATLFFVPTFSVWCTDCVSGPCLTNPNIRSIGKVTGLLGAFMKVEQQDEQRVITTGTEEPDRSARGWWLAILVVAVVAVIVVFTMLPRIQARNTVARETQEMAIPSVSVVHPKHTGPLQEVVLPANVQAYIDAPIMLEPTAICSAGTWILAPM